MNDEKVRYFGINKDGYLVLNYYNAFSERQSLVCNDQQMYEFFSKEENKQLFEKVYKVLSSLYEI